MILRNLIIYEYTSRVKKHVTSYVKAIAILIDNPQRCCKNSSSWSITRPSSPYLALTKASYRIQVLPDRPLIKASSVVKLDQLGD